MKIGIVGHIGISSCQIRNAIRNAIGECDVIIVDANSSEFKRDDNLDNFIEHMAKPRELLMKEVIVPTYLEKYDSQLWKPKHKRK